MKSEPIATVEEIGAILKFDLSQETSPLAELVSVITLCFHHVPGAYR